MLDDFFWAVKICRHPKPQVEDLLNHEDGSDVRAFRPVYMYLYNVLFLPETNFKQNLPLKVKVQRITHDESEKHLSSYRRVTNW